MLLAVGETDGDRIDRLARTAIDIAGPAGATVALSHVFGSDEYEQARRNLNLARDGEATPDDVARRYVTVRELGDAMDAAGVAYTSHGRLAEGSRGERVVELAEDLGADLVVVGGRKRSPSGKAVFGSTAQEILLTAPCPVTFVRAD